MKQSVKFKSITTGFTSEYVLPFFNSVLEAKQYLLALALNIGTVSTDLVNSSAPSETHRLALQSLIPPNISACISLNELSPVLESNACKIITTPYMALYTGNGIELDPDTYDVNGTTITLTEAIGGWTGDNDCSFKAIGVKVGQRFYPINNRILCNGGYDSVSYSNWKSSMNFDLFLPCIVPLTDGTTTLQFMHLRTSTTYMWYNSSTRKFVAQDANWWVRQTFSNTYFIINAPKPELPSISGETTDDIDTETGASDTDDSENNVGGDGNVTLINNVVNYDNYTPNYARVDTGFICAFEVTPTELNTLHSFLYGETVVDLIKNYFAGDATKAIVDLFNIPLAPQVEATSTEIKVGVVPTGAHGNALSSETVTFDFGSIDITQGYNSNTFMDLDPYNKYMVYLPFIGFRNLNTDDVRSINDKGFKIYLKYVVDMLTGDFVAIVEADHNNAVFDNKTGEVTTAKLTKQVINTFSGNMRTAIPLTSINAREMLNTGLGAITGAVASIATGNPLTMAMGAGQTLNSMASYNNALIPRGDSLSGNLGNLTINKAFIINQEAPKYIRTGKSNQFTGYPVFKYLKITPDRGYVKVKNVIMSNFAGTANEQARLEELLKKGVRTK